MSLLGKMMKKTATGFVISSATAVAVKGISNALGLSDSKVGKILAVGIPMMTVIAADDKKITDNLFKASKKKDRDDKNGFFDIFGDKGHKMSKAIAEEAGATEDEVNGVMNMFMPIFLDGIAEEEPEDAEGLGKMLKKDSEDVQKKSPSLAKMAMKAVF